MFEQKWYSSHNLMVTQSAISLALADHQEEFTHNKFRTTGVIREAAQIKSPKNWSKVVMGPRRSGKSTFCQQNCDPNRTIYINFDDERLFGLKVENLQIVYETALSLKPNFDTLIFDEIQNVDGWELFINRLQRKGLQIWVTGSNSKLLSRELATHLTGRAFPIEIYPFSFREWLRARQVSWDSLHTSKEKSNLIFQFDEFLKIGGFPELIQQDDPKPYLRTIFDQIVQKDIAQRHPRVDSALLKQVALHSQQFYSTRMSYRQLERSIEGASINTIKQILLWLEEAYLLFQLSNRTQKLRQVPKIPRKLYSIDTGMLDALRLKLTPDLGLILENFVYLEIKKCGWDCFSFSSPEFEVDLLVQQENRVSEIIQVAYEISNSITEEREVSALLKGSALFRCDKLKIITRHEEGEFKREGKTIQVMPAWKWALDLKLKNHCPRY